MLKELNSNELKQLNQIESNLYTLTQGDLGINISLNFWYSDTSISRTVHNAKTASNLDMKMDIKDYDTLSNSKIKCYTKKGIEELDSLAFMCLRCGC